MAIESVRLYGAPSGVPGVQVRETVGSPPSAPLKYGTTAFVGGILKRGPMGVPIPLSGRSQYDQIFSKPGESTWHLYDDSTFYGYPDAIDGFFSESKNTGVLWLIRNELDGTGRPATKTLYARSNRLKPVLEIEAANPGRWAGYRQSSFWGRVIFFEDDEFTMSKAGIGVNELKGAKVTFRKDTTTLPEVYTILSNTKSGPDNTVVCKVDKDTKLAAVMEASNFVSTLQLTGKINYQRYIDLSGTVDYVTQTSISGTVSIRKTSTTVIGNNTSFLTELKKGEYIWIGGVKRLVTAIVSDSKLIVNEPFYLSLDTATVEIPNYELTGTTTLFDSELEVGDALRFTFGSNFEERSVTAIASDTSLTLNAELPDDLTGATVELINRWVEGVGTDFENELEVGVAISSFEGATVNEVKAIDTVSVPERFALTTPLPQNLTNANVVVHRVYAIVDLQAPVNGGLSVKIGNGKVYPDTHFSLEVLFEGKTVFQAPDVSLDPNDRCYVEESVNNANVAYLDDGVKYYTWIKATSLLEGAYKTGKGDDNRPANNFAKVTRIDLTTKRLYYFADNDVDYLSGTTELYFSPYEDPRRSVKSSSNLVRCSKMPGKITSNGTTVTGVGTYFNNYFVVGDYFYNHLTDEVREITAIASATSLTVAEAFSEDIPAGSDGYRQGVVFLPTSILTDLEVGKEFMIVFPTDLVNGYDGDDTQLDSDLVTRYFDPVTNILEKAALGRNQGMIRMATPGITDPAVQTEALRYAAERAYEYRVEIPSSCVDAISAENYILKELGLNDFMSVSFPSFGEIKDPRDGRPRLISLTGDIMGIETFKASTVGGFHNVAAGLSSVLTRIRTLPLYLDPYADETLLNQVGIQPIVRKNGIIMPFGIRIPSATSVYRLAHVRRNQSQYIRMFAESIKLQSMLFKINDPGWDQEVMLYLRGFFEKEKAKGALANSVTFGDSVLIEKSAGENLGGQGNDVYISIVNGEVFLNISYTPCSIVEKIILTVSPREVVSSTY